MKTKQIIIKAYGTVIRLGMLLLLMAGTATAAQPLPDIGMVIRLTGAVTYWHEGAEAKPLKVQTFMKVRKNDNFSLSPHGVVQLVYFSNGRKETWTGPGAFMVGDSRSHAVGEPGSSGSPQVLSLPTAVVDEVKRVSPLVDPSRLHRSGGAQVRGIFVADTKEKFKSAKLGEEDKKEIEAAEQTYRSFLKKVDQKDITPELYLFSVLADYDQFESMKKLIDTMHQKQPDNAGIDRLEEWLIEQGM